MIRKVDFLTPVPWVTQATPKALSHPQLSNNGWTMHVMSKGLRKLKSNPRNQMALLQKMFVFIPVSASTSHEGQVHAFAFKHLDKLRLTLFLEGPLFWHYIGLLLLTLPSLVLLTQLNVLQSVHTGHLLNHWQVLLDYIGQLSSIQSNQFWWPLCNWASLSLLLLNLWTTKHHHALVFTQSPFPLLWPMSNFYTSIICSFYCKILPKKNFMKWTQSYWPYHLNTYHNRAKSRAPGHKEEGSTTTWAWCQISCLKKYLLFLEWEWKDKHFIILKLCNLRD